MTRLNWTLAILLAGVVAAVGVAMLMAVMP